MTEDLPPNDILKEIYRTGCVVGENGEKMNLHSAISEVHAWALYQAVLKIKPRICVEIGMCYALSTLSILTALQINDNGGRLISIDPYQTDPEHEKGIGLLNVKRAGLEDLHELIGEPSYLALPKLLGDDLKIDFAYIDGWHTFDYALLDFFYIDKMMVEGAVVGFNDCGWRSVHKAIKFVEGHRHYKELDVGLKRSFKSRNQLFSVIKRFEGRNGADRYFQKQDDWEPSYKYYKQF